MNILDTPTVLSTGIPSGAGRSCPAELQGLIDQASSLPFGAALLVGTGTGPGECQALRTHVKRQLPETFRVTARNHGENYGFYIANDRKVTG